jgi:hypothetical protein
LSDPASRTTIRSVFVTAQTAERSALLVDVADALEALGVEAQVDGDVLVVDGARLVPHLVGRAHPTPADLDRLVAEDRGRLPALVVADRISEPGRDVLRDAGWGWLDRRGHLRLWAPGARIEAPLPAAGRTGRSAPANAWTTVGLEIALAALCDPGEPVTARRVAATIGRSVGATHELIARFAELGLIGPKTHRPLLPDLFWETSARWPDDGWVGLPATLEEVADRVGPQELVRVDERAATLGGARIAAAGDLPARCYLRSAAALRRARSLAERDRDRDRERAEVRTWVRAAPVRWLPTNPDHPADDGHPWAIAHPLVCALRLAADPSRGREIVEAWGIVPGEDHGRADRRGA